MSKDVLYIGLDVHAEDIAVAIAEAGRDGEVRDYGVIPNTLHSVEKLLRKLGQPGKELRVCYEAGPKRIKGQTLYLRGCRAPARQPQRQASKWFWGSFRLQTDL